MTTPRIPADRSADLRQHRIALIGFGEVGQTLGADFASSGVRDVTSWDVLFPSPRSGPSLAAARSAHVRVTASMREALEGRDILISAVTAGQCYAAAREAAASLPAGCYYLDLNSVSPETRAAAAAAVENSGARYIEGAVMSPIAPKRSASPILLGGPHCTEFALEAAQIGLTSARPYSPIVGRASAAKMCRSVIVKGFEALLAESLLSARRHGVEETVIESLRDLFPLPNWSEHARYMISRSLQHGRRRAEEMREVAKTVSESGLDPWMSEACAKRQDWAGDLGPVSVEQPLPEFLDAVIGLSGRDRDGAT